MYMYVITYIVIKIKVINTYQFVNKNIIQRTNMLLLYIVSNFFKAIFVELMGESFKSENKAIDTAFCTSATG